MGHQNITRHQSNIYYLCEKYDVSFSNFNTEGINDLVKNKFAIEDAFLKKLLPFKQNIHDKLGPYLMGRDISILSGYGTFGSDFTAIGNEFFDELEPPLFDVIIAKIKAFASKTWEAIKYGLTTSYNWAAEKIDKAFSWWSGVFVGGIAALTGGLSGLFSYIGKKLSEFFDWLTGSDGGDIDGSDIDDGTTEGEDDIPATRGGDVTPGKRYNDVESMQKVMNRYLQKYNLTASPTEEDGRWGADTDRLWDVVVNHSFDNHPVFSQDPDQDRYNDGHHMWGEMASALQDDNGPNYVGYVARPSGALAMILDMYNGNVEFGNGKQLPGSVGPGTLLADSEKAPSGEGETETSAQKEVDPTLGSGTPKSTNTGIGERGVQIRVETGKTGVNTLEDMGFDPGTTRAVSLKIIEGIKKPNFSGTDNEGIILKVSFNRNGKVNGQILLGKVQKLSELLAFKFGTLKSIKDLLAAQGDTIDKDEVNYKGRLGGGKFFMTVTVPGGVKNV